METHRPNPHKGESLHSWHHGLTLCGWRHFSKHAVVPNDTSLTSWYPVVAQGNHDKPYYIILYNQQSCWKPLTDTNDEPI